MTGARPDPADHVPLKPLVFHILLVLVQGERHGYSIVKEVAANTDGSLKVEPGNLYRTLRTMLTRGLIEEMPERPDPDLDDQRRRYFRMTRLGDDVLRLEAARMEQLASAARSEFAAVGHEGPN